MLRSLQLDTSSNNLCSFIFLKRKGALPFTFFFLLCTSCGEFLIGLNFTCIVHVLCECYQLVFQRKWFHNPFPNDKFKTLPNRKNLRTTILNLMKMVEVSPKGLKTLWEKEKLFVMSNFSFPTVFSKDLYC